MLSKSGELEMGVSETRAIVQSCIRQTSLRRSNQRIEQPWRSVPIAGLVWSSGFRPVDQAIDLLKSKVDGLGFWGLLALGAAYVVAALAFFPGSALTLTAGALFGLTWGTVTVSLASTTAAALAFLIARYLAREKVTPV